MQGLEATHVSIFLAGNTKRIQSSTGIQDTSISTKNSLAQRGAPLRGQAKAPQLQSHLESQD